MELLAPKEVRSILKCSLPYVYKLAERGLMPCVRIPCIGKDEKKSDKRSLLRFKQSDVFEFIDRHYNGKVT